MSEQNRYRKNSSLVEEEHKYLINDPTLTETTKEIFEERIDVVEESAIRTPSKTPCVEEEITMQQFNDSNITDIFQTVDDNNLKIENNENIPSIEAQGNLDNYKDSELHTLVNENKIGDFHISSSLMSSADQLYNVEMENDTLKGNYIPLSISESINSDALCSYARSENCDFDLIMNRFQENKEDFLNQDDLTKETFEEGSRVLKNSFTTFLENLNVTEKDTLEEDDDLKHLVDVDWRFWAQVVNDFPQVAKNESKKLEKMISNGIPSEIRGIIWQLMTSSKSKEIEDLYNDLIQMESVHQKAILRDISRTKFIPKDKTDSLFRVIKAYSLFDPEVGYTQGMAFITTPLLLHTEKEADTFGLLIKLMKNYGLRELFLPEMPGLHLKLYQFDRLLEENSPSLYNHLTRQGIRSSMYATQWFLTFFAYKFPLTFVLRIFDIVLVEGIEAILKFAVVLILKNERELSKLNFDELINYLKDGLFIYYLKDCVKKQQSELEYKDTSPCRISEESFNFVKPEIKDDNYDTNRFVYDAINEVKITPLQLKRFIAEYEEIHELEFQKEAQYEEMKIKNKQLQREIRKLEHDYTLLNREHITMANELIQNRLEISTLKDENNDLRSMITELQEQLAGEVRKRLLPNPDSEIPNDLKKDLSKTMERNIEVMDQNQELQERIATLETQIKSLKNGKSKSKSSSQSISHIKSPSLSGWGFKKPWKS